MERQCEMPGKRSPKPTEQQRDQAKLMWAMNPGGDWTGVANWEPRGEEFTEAVLQVLASGAAIMIRPGSGGRALGIAIWEGDTRHPATWCYDDEEVNMWAAEIINRVKPKATPEAAD